MTKLLANKLHVHVRGNVSHNLACTGAGSGREQDRALAQRMQAEEDEASWRSSRASSVPMLHQLRRDVQKKRPRTQAVAFSLGAGPASSRADGAAANTPD